MPYLFVHLCGYRFTQLSDLEDLRTQTKARCRELDLKGTVLLAQEGINFGVSGSRVATQAFKNWASEIFKMNDSSFKESLSSAQPFHRFLVKIKREIIPVGDSTLKPSHQTGQRILPAELKKWLDEGRPIRLLDARNRYEVETGTFVGAEALDLDSSREFKDKALLLAQESAQNESSGAEAPIVTFCTGGIRCEKASALLLKLGFRDVYQLEGGILNYFAVNGAAHFRGHCFVFDWRMAVDGSLNPVARSVQADAKFGRHKIKTANKTSPPTMAKISSKSSDAL